MLRLEADINGVAAKIVEDFKHSEEFPATGEKAVKRFKTSEELSIGFAKEFANGFELFRNRSAKSFPVLAFLQFQATDEAGESTNH